MAFDPGKYFIEDSSTYQDKGVYEGRLDWIIYEEMPNVAEGGAVHDGETAADEL